MDARRRQKTDHALLWLGLSLASLFVCLRALVGLLVTAVQLAFHLGRLVWLFVEAARLYVRDSRPVDGFILASRTPLSAPRTGRAGPYVPPPHSPANP